MMVVIQQERVRGEMERRGLSETGLAAAMDVHFNTVRNLLKGLPVSHRTQRALFNAFGGHVPFAQLFEVTDGAEAAQAVGGGA